MNESIVDGHDAECGQVVPAEAHGDECEVCMVLLVPLGCSKGREQHKPNLEGYTEKTACQSLPVGTKGIQTSPTTSVPIPALAQMFLYRRIAGLILVLV